VHGRVEHQAPPSQSHGLSFPLKGSLQLGTICMADNNSKDEQQKLQD
jgi:hypothetical protein